MNEVVNDKVEEVKQNAQANNESDKKGTDATQENPEQINWKKFREGREQDRKAKELAEREAAKKAEEVTALKMAMEAMLNKPQQSTQETSDESEDDRITRRVEEALAKKEKQYEEDRIQREHQEFPHRLVANFSDFDQVCTAENLDYLEYHYPEVSAPYKHLPDGYDKWAAIYKAVKRFVPNPTSKTDQRKAEKNFNKPQSMSVAGTTQTTDSAPVMLDDKRRQANWQRMQRTMRGGR